MTDAEIELIRDAQDIDLRIDVLTKMIDRRFNALSVDVGGWKQGGKGSEEWGEQPKGTRTQLLSDIKKLLQKAIDDIDNLAANPNAAPIRDEEEKSSKQAKRDARRFPDAVRLLAAAAKRYQPALGSLLEKSETQADRGLSSASLEFCEQIIAASVQLASEPPKK